MERARRVVQVDRCLQASSRNASSVLNIEISTVPTHSTDYEFESCLLVLILIT
jgi:hypothetical protein